MQCVSFTLVLSLRFSFLSLYLDGRMFVVPASTYCSEGGQSIEGSLKNKRLEFVWDDVKCVVLLSFRKIVQIRKVEDSGVTR